MAVHKGVPVCHPSVIGLKWWAALTEAHVHVFMSSSSDGRLTSDHKSTYYSAEMNRYTKQHGQVHDYIVLKS